MPPSDRICINMNCISEKKRLNDNKRNSLSDCRPRYYVYCHQRRFLGEIQIKLLHTSYYIQVRAKSCETCQKAKVHAHTKMTLERRPAPTKRFSHINVDLAGPLNAVFE